VQWLDVRLKGNVCFSPKGDIDLAAAPKKKNPVLDGVCVLAYLTWYKKIQSG